MPSKSFSLNKEYYQYLRECELEAALAESKTDLEKTYGKALALLEANPHHPSLRLHALKGRLEGLHSISINLNYILTMELIITDKEIILINVGDHDQVY